jgi:antitoxin MazE
MKVIKDYFCNYNVNTKVMQIPIIQIGNSKGIRLTKPILERYQLTDKIELIFEDDHIVLKPVVGARAGWEDAFKKMHEEGDDALLIDDIFEDERLEE